MSVPTNTDAQRPSGAPVVIKLGGEVVQGPTLATIAADLAALCKEGVPVIVVSKLNA